MIRQPEDFKTATALIEKAKATAHEEREKRRTEIVLSISEDMAGHNAQLAELKKHIDPAEKSPVIVGLAQEGTNDYRPTKGTYAYETLFAVAARNNNRLTASARLGRADTTDIEIEVVASQAPPYSASAALLNIMEEAVFCVEGKWIKLNQRLAITAAYVADKSA